MACLYVAASLSSASWYVNKIIAEIPPVGSHTIQMAIAEG
jgi:hypothetical protein